ncbi:MAG: bifunctional lysylphosphatidylglycerol flippase/synthetase MprF [Trueperella sp.]|nr:bifunctional lysylphosphatidylglycerol flippase/synthetase MprF [Trueperella sp.]
MKNDATAVSATADTESPAAETLATRLKKFFGAHKRVITWVFYAVMILAVVLVAHNQITEISGAELGQLLAAQQPGVITGFFALGVVAFLATGLYDVFASKQFAVDIPLFSALKIGWVAQALNNFAGLGGLTGGTIRTKYYTRYGAETKLALNVTLAVWLANLIGLFVMLLATMPLAIHWDGAFLVVPLLACLYVPLYFFGQKIHFGKLNLANTPLGSQNARAKLEMTFASVVDWLAAAVFFWACLRLFAPTAPLYATIFVYATATIIGLLSMLPAGLGSFDIAVLTMMGMLGFGSERLLLGVLLFRISYYLLPWLLSLIVLAKDFALKLTGLTQRSQIERILHLMLVALASLSGGYILVSNLHPIAFEPAWMRYTIPYNIQISASLTKLFIGVILLAIAWGLYKRIYRVYQAAVLLVLIGWAGELIRGVHYRDILFIGIFSLLLYLARDAFTVDPKYLTISNLIHISLIATVTPVALITVKALLVKKTISELTLWDALNLAANPAHAHLAVRIPFYFCLGFAFGLILLSSRARRLDFVPMTAAEITEFLEFEEKWGGTGHSYLFALGDKQVFYNRAKTVAFLYRPHRGVLVQLGDPLGKREDVEDALDEFFDFADANNMTVIFYEVSGEYLSDLLDDGMRIIKIGEDADMDLTCYSNVGNKGKIYRRMRNRMKQNETWPEILYPPFTEQQLDEIEQVSDSWLADRTEMGFSLGFFDRDYLSLNPILVVRSEERVEGFANLIRNNETTFSFDLMRIRPDAPGGTMDGILVSLIEWAKDNGYRYMNLGMAPLSEVGTGRYSHGASRVVKLIHDFGNRIYNFRGLRSYKEKFSPQWHSRYLAYPSGPSLPSLLFSLLELINRPKQNDALETVQVRHTVREIVESTAPQRSE